MYQYQTHFDFLHDSIVENHGSVAYYLKLFSLLDFSAIPRYNMRIGRRGYSNHTMIKIALIGVIERLNTYPAHRRFLIDRPRLCELIGLRIRGGQFALPSDATLSNFYNSEDYASLLKTLFTKSLQSHLPALLHRFDYLCVDSQPVLANTALNNPKDFSTHKVSRDKDAKWGVKGKSNAPSHSKEKVHYYYGYKIHMLSLGPIPLAYQITPANAHDGKFLRVLLQNVMESFSLCSLNVCADKGYDSNANFDFVHDVFKGKAFIPKRRTSSFETPRGRCESLLKLHSTYVEKQRQVLKSKFVCPLFEASSASAACPFQEELGVSDYSCTAYRNLRAGKHRDWIHPSFPQFKRVYRKRMDVENLFSIAQDGRLKRINGYSKQYLDNKVTLFNLFIVLSASLAIAMGKDDWLLSTVKLKDSIAA